jgi:putative ABC transport system ATP-binding protein
MQRTLYKFILKHTLKEQIYLVLFTLLSLPFIYAFLTIPKLIINDAIGGKDVPETFMGYAIDQYHYLLILCLVFLILVLINGGFKFLINLFQRLIGERALKVLREQTYTTILSFPIPKFKRYSSVRYVRMTTGNIKRVGGFIGESINIPVRYGGTLLTILFFVFLQDFYLGIAAIILFPIQLYLTVILQHKVNTLNLKRRSTLRKLSEKVGESALNINEIHIHDLRDKVKVEYNYLVDKLYIFRKKTFLFKYFLKFMNNFMNHFTPFLFYGIGGYLVLDGDLTLGGLVSILAAHKDLQEPWKELIHFYQSKEDIKTRYDHLIDELSLDDGIPEVSSAKIDHAIDTDRYEMIFRNVYYSPDRSKPALEGVTLALPLNRRIAIVAGTEEDKSSFAMILAGLIEPTSGQVLIHTEDDSFSPAEVLGTSLQYIENNGQLFSGSMRHNFIKKQSVEINDDAIHKAIKFAGIDIELFHFGLNNFCSLKRIPERINQRVLAARKSFHQVLEQQNMSRYFEVYDEDKYHKNSSFLDNILFGRRKRPMAAAQMLQDAYFRWVLKKSSLELAVIEVGLQLAELMIELFADIAPGHPFFEQFSFIHADDFDFYETIIKQTKGVALPQLDETAKLKLMAIALELVPAKHQLNLITPILEKQIVEARKLYRKHVPEKEKIAFYDVDRLNRYLSPRDNIMFGKLVHGQAYAFHKAEELLHSVLLKLDMEDDFIDIALAADVGLNGDNLSPSMKQKIYLASNFVEMPQLLIGNEPTLALDSQTQTHILKNILSNSEIEGIIWVVHQAHLAQHFDTVLVLQEGRIVEQGHYDDLITYDSEYKRILISESEGYEDVA